MLTTGVSGIRQCFMAVTSEAVEQPTAQTITKDIYVESILLLERLHRRFLDVIKAELDQLKVDDINNVQTLILYNIGKEELTIGELTQRGYYLGSNVSYNVKKMVENGYLIQEQSAHDKRSFKVRLSPKGLGICERIDRLYEEHVSQLSHADMDSEKLSHLNHNLRHLESFWTRYIQTRYLL
jgi:DNA-binding MarR family transcriptional regulator